MVFCPGLNSTQAELHELAELLRRDHDVVTFDLRGHGLASAADRYFFEAFLSDLVAVMSELGHTEPGAAPLLVGYSLGADLVVHYASEHPGTVAELVLIDGANPVPEPFITEADLPGSAQCGRRWRTSRRACGAPQGRCCHRARRFSTRTSRSMRSGPGSSTGTGRSTRPISHDHVDLDGRRQRRRACAAVQPELARRGASGWSATSRTHHLRLNADHQLVFTHAPEIAQIIRSARARPARRLLTKLWETGSMLTIGELASYAGVTVAR